MFHKIIQALIFIYESFFKKAVGAQDAAEIKEGSTAVNASDVSNLEGPPLEDVNFEIDAAEVDSFNTKRLHVLDPGHVQTTPGKSSPPFADGTILHEYEINHDVVRRIAAILRVTYGFKEGRDFIVTMDPYSKFKSTYQEIKHRFEVVDAYKNGKEMLFYSIHHNAVNHGGKWQPPSGTETWYQRGNEKSKQVAALFQKNLVAALSFKNRGLKFAAEGTREFMVFRECNDRGIIGTLLEIGFFSNLKEAKRLKSGLYRDTAANAIARTIAELEGLTIK